MGLREKLKAGHTINHQSFIGQHPPKAKGFHRVQDVHQEDGKYTSIDATHASGHTILDIKGEPVKYSDNLPA